MVGIGRVWLIVMVALVAGCGGGGGDLAGELGADPSAPLLPSGPPASNDPGAELPRFDVRDVDQLYPFRQNSPFAAVLKQCALAAATEEICRLSTLPYIGQGNADVTIEDILDRLLVTHDWMGQRFAELLEDAPADLIALFGSITSISIGSTVRPSFYRNQTGAIRLDPEVLWLSFLEKANVSTEEDPRSDYGRDLQFFTFAAYQIDGRPAYDFFTLTDYQERTLADIRVPVFRLLFHELAHAVDYVQFASLAGLDSQLTPRDVARDLRSQRLSVRLNYDLELRSELMYGLAQVRFRGEDATEAQKNLTSSDVGAAMAGDGAAKFYGYSTVREDVATLLATAMIKKHFNVDYSMAYVQKPDNLDSYVCTDLLVGWGVRNRLADPLVVPRAKWVVDQIYGESAENEQFFNNGLNTQSLMTPGLNWCANRDAGVIASRANAGSINPLREFNANVEQRRLRSELLRWHH